MLVNRRIYATLAIGLAIIGDARAEQALRVVGVASNDVLNVRELPTASSKIVGVIPPDARGVSPNGERSGNWIFVSHRRVEGWVDRRFVSPERPAIRRGRSYDDDLTE